jgi:large subunit ribosomal protein L7/L12
MPKCALPGKEPYSKFAHGAQKQSTPNKLIYNMLIDNIYKNNKSDPKMPTLEEMKKKRDQLTARIQQAEARNKANERKEETKTKVLIGAMVLKQIQMTQDIEIESVEDLKAKMLEFLTRDSDKAIVEKRLAKF